MSSSYEELQVKLALESSNFSKQVSAINKEIKNLEKDFKSASQGNKQFENSFTGLSAKMQKTERQIDLYNKKLESQRKEYNKVNTQLTQQKSKLDSLANTVGKNSKEWKDQAQLVQKNSEKLRRLSTDINKTQSNIGRLKNELSQSAQKFEQLGNKALTIDEKLSRINRQANLTESEFNRLGAELNQSGTYFQKLGNEMQQLGAKIQSNKSKLNAYESEISKLNTNLTQNKQTHSQLKTEINQTKNALEQAKSKFGSNSTEAQQLHTKLLQLKDAYNQSEHEIEQSSAALDRYQADVNNTRADITRLSAQLRQMPFNTIGQSMVSSGQKIKGVGQSLGMYVTMPLGMMGTAATKAGVNFDTSMSKLQATAGIADKSSVSFQKLQEKAQDLGARTSFSASEAADGLTYLALAGWDVETSLSRIEPVLRAAEAGGMDLALCSDLVTDSMSSAGIASKDFTKYLDITAQAQRKSNTSMQQMLEAYVVAGGIFKNLNMPLEKSGALLGVLANRGTKGSEAGNAIISVFSNLITEAGQAGKALKELKISLFDKKTGKQRDTIEVLKEMAQKLGVTADGTSKLTEAEQAQYAAMVGGKTQYDSLMKMLAGVSDEYDDLENNLRNSKGSLMEVAKTMKDNLGGAITNMKSALEGAGIQAFKAMEPVLASLIEKITQLSNWFTNLSESSQQSIVKMAAMAAALAPILIAFGQLIIVGGNLTLIIGHIKAAMTATTGTSTSLLTKLGNLTTKLFSLQGAFSLLAVAGIGVAVKALHDYSVQDGKLYEQRKRNIESLEREKKAYQETKEKIGNIAKEYDTLKNKSELSNEEAERLKVLTKEIAELMPELVNGYDDGNPILKMKGSAEDLCSELDRAIEKKERLISFDRIDNAEIAVDKQGGKRDKEGNKLTGKAADSYQTDVDKVKNIQRKYNDDMTKLEEQGRFIRGQIQGAEVKDREKYIQKYNEHLRKKEKLTQDAQKESERSLEEAKKVAQEVEEGVFATVKSSSTFKSSKNNGAKKQFDELKGFLDFSGIKTQEQLSNAESAMNKLFKSASDGKINLSDIKKEIEDANDSLSKDGNLSSYNKKMQELSKTIADKTGTKSSDWISLLTTLDKEFLRTSDSTDVFLKKFNRTRQQLESGEGLAIAVQKQYDELNSAIEGLQITGVSDVDVQTVIDFTNNQNIPEDIRNFVNGLIKKDSDGNITNSKEVIKFTADLLFELQQENPNFDNLQSEADRLFGENKVKVTEDLEITEGEIDTSNVKTDDVNEQIKNKFAKDKVSAKINVAIENGSINSDKVKLVGEIFDKIPTEYKTKFILENTDAINKAETYNDIIKYLKENPEIAQKYDIKIDGLDKAKEANKETDKGNKTVKTDVQVTNAEKSKEEIEAVGKEADKVNEKKAEPEITTKGVEGTAEQLNQLAEKAQKVGQGKYEINIVAKTQIAAKNISGLITRVNDFIKLKVKTLVFRTETAQGSKNVTGLINKVKSYDNKYGGKTIKTKFDALTSVAAKNISGLIRKIESFKENYAGKTFTTTFSTNKVTNTTTGGNNNSDKDNKSIQRATPEPMAINKIQDERNVTSRNNRATMLNNSRKLTIDTPINLNIDASFKYDIEILKELENQINKVSSSLSLLSKKMENASDNDKIKYLQEQNELYKEQQRLLKRQEGYLSQEQSRLKQLLGNNKEYTFHFNADGNITDYEENLIKIQQKLIELDGKSGDDKSIEKKKKSLEETKKILEQYIKVTFTDLPKCQEEWQSIANEINNATEEVKKLKQEQDKLYKESTWVSISKDVEQVKNELELIDVKMQNASEDEKEELLKKKIELLKKYKKELAETTDYMKQVQGELKGKLQKFGFEFRDNGDISNYIQQLQKLKKENKNFDEAKELVDAYLELLIHKIPDAEKEITSITNSIVDVNKEQEKLIEDSYRKQLDTIKYIEGKVTDVYKKQLEERKKVIEEELKAKTDALDKEKKAYNDARKEADYKNDYQEQSDKVSELEKQIDIAKRDTSLSGQKKLQDLQKQLKEEQKKLQDLVQDHIDDQVNNMFDNESERLENESDKTIKDLEEKFSDINIKKLVKEALDSGIFENIDGSFSKLKDTMLEFTDKYGDGLSITGDLIKTELIKNLDTAVEKMKDLNNIMETISKADYGMSLQSLNVDYSSQRYNPSPITSVSNTTNNNQRSEQIEINYNAPLVVVQGNATKDIMPNLEKFGRDLENRVYRKIVENIKS
ncbi:TPA: phage tail tape measure protein [Clostridioides difficile]|uniref:phage tail tape measure protein n=1 Tax=Clostridioides difficile TaxID=1496 RepID=UPI002A1F8617|nr:phage tail tape measure protein [Clostridioides difficile]HEK5040796.1 phage tail tape measure protein [Clostridioides difficile]